MGGWLRRGGRSRPLPHADAGECVDVIGARVQGVVALRPSGRKLRGCMLRSRLRGGGGRRLLPTGWRRRCFDGKFALPMHLNCFFNAVFLWEVSSAKRRQSKQTRIQRHALGAKGSFRAYLSVPHRRRVAAGSLRHVFCSGADVGSKSIRCCSICELAGSLAVRRYGHGLFGLEAQLNMVLHCGMRPVQARRRSLSGGSNVDGGGRRQRKLRPLSHSQTLQLYTVVGTLWTGILHLLDRYCFSGNEKLVYSLPPACPPCPAAALPPRAQIQTKSKYLLLGCNRASAVPSLNSLPCWGAVKGADAPCSAPSRLIQAALRHSRQLTETTLLRFFTSSVS